VIIAQAAVELNAANRIIQFAATLLQMGGAILIATLFAVASRSSQRRGYFTTWMVGWFAMAMAICAIAVRYVLLPAAPSGPPPDRALEVQALYWLYASGKLAYWVLIWRGIVEYTNPGTATWSRRRWIGVAAIAGTISWFFQRDLNEIVFWQAPVAVACCFAGALALSRMGKARRTAGSTTIAWTLVVTGVLWSLYFVAFGGVTRLLPFTLGSLQRPLLAFNSYVDMLMLVVLGYAMLMVFMEDARRRIDNIETRLGSLVVAAPDPIFTLDSQQRIVAANKAAEQVFGVVANAEPVSNLVETAHREKLRAAIAAFAEGGEAAQLVGEDGSLRGIKGDGTQFTAEFTISRLFDADVAAVSLVVRDVTGRREQEERRRQASTMEAVRQLAGGLAHDFNNLLTTIVGRSQIVARTLPASSPVREDVMQIEQAAAAAARLSKGLLALSRREPLNPERVAVDEVVRAAEPGIRAHLNPRVTCSFELGACDVYAHVDRSRLEAALIALVRNGVEAIADTGTVTIETSSALMPQQFGPNAEAACITVRDTGAGLDADARAHLFEPFFSTKGDGRGLGLATTWAFVHQSGGTVDVESGRLGTVVRILFPMAVRPAAADVAPASPPALAIVPDAPRPRRTVLIAEDEPSVRRSVRVFLERAGYTVVEAADGVEALAAFERTPDDFGMLLTDVMMPQMGGRDLAMRVMERRPELPVVFMSGFLRDPEVLRMVNDRRVRFIAKPFDVDTLISTVRASIEDANANVA
jgi:PAS domain S-box-containing protein